MIQVYKTFFTNTQTAHFTKLAFEIFTGIYELLFLPALTFQGKRDCSFTGSRQTS